MSAGENDGRQTDANLAIKLIPHWDRANRTSAGTLKCWLDEYLVCGVTRRK